MAGTLIIFAPADGFTGMLQQQEVIDTEFIVLPCSFVDAVLSNEEQ